MFTNQPSKFFFFFGIDPFFIMDWNNKFTILSFKKIHTQPPLITVRHFWIDQGYYCFFIKKIYS